MARRKRLSLSDRKRLQAQLAELRRYDEEQFALRLECAAKLLPEESRHPHFAVLVRQLWTDGAQEASLREWETSLPKRWGRLVESLGGLSDGLNLEGGLDDNLVDAIAALLVHTHTRNQVDSNWRGAVHA